MLILFDQGTPVGISGCLSEHVVKTAYERGWSTLLNGELLSAAENEGFQILLTADKNLVYQQNLTGRKIAIIVLSTNRWSLIQPSLTRISEAVANATPGSYMLVEIGMP